jgi:glycosyltransferase involved in cell wall biosynthesis
MRVLLVIDQMLHANNGTTMTAQHLAHALEEHNHEVRIACQASPGDDTKGLYIYPQPELHVPVFQGLIDAQGMTLAKGDTHTLAAALRWCDVAHFMMPFNLGHIGAKLAREMGVPATAAFHVQPENISCSIHMGNFKLFNDFLYRFFRRRLYQYVRHVHCPSQMIANQLQLHGYANQLHVISNGIDGAFTYRKLPKAKDLAGRIVVTMVGRYSVEKHQDVAIRAVAHSKHRDDITLVLAGQGPTERSLRGLAAHLGADVRFGFLSQERLRDLLAMSDVYVHASEIEVEAMSCMEAFATGLVPIIADSPLSATPQFALDARSLFRAGDSADLVRHLDWWIDHPKARAEMGHTYAQLGERYRLDHCVSRFEGMLEEAIADAQLESLPNMTPSTSESKTRNV